MQEKDAEVLNGIHLRDIRDLPAEIYWCRATGKNLNRHAQTLRMHHHTFFELHFVCEGKMVYELKNQTVIVEKGNYLLIAPTVPHRIQLCSEDFIKLSVAFSVSSEENLYLGLLAKTGISHPISVELYSAIEFLLREAARHGEFSNYLIRNRVSEMICLIPERILPDPYENIPEQIADERVFRAKMYIADNGDSFLTCSEVANYCCLSAKQLGRLFLRQENCTLLQYIHREKAAAAAQMIRDGDAPFKEICQKLGFSSVPYFHKFFTQHIGMTPGDYRRSGKKIDCKH